MMSPDTVYNEFGYIDLQGNQSGSLTTKSFVVDGETYTVKLRPKRRTGFTSGSTRNCRSGSC